MIDGCGRSIDYLRISVTDRCNLRCRYCMPLEGVELVRHDDLLRIEEILRLTETAVKLGITRFKITGGEPLVRRGCIDLIREMKAISGVEQVTITTNGVLLPQYLDGLLAAGIDGVNISLDTLDEAQYRAVTRSNGSAESVVSAAVRCAQSVRTKINAVLLADTRDQIIPLAELAEKLPLDVRFIETMPIGEGARQAAHENSVLDALKTRWGDLQPTDERRGNGPARYYQSEKLQGCIGLIEALSHAFCAQCNRLRLTSTGMLLPCLYYDEGADMRALLRSGASDAELKRAMEETILSKPAGHMFAAGVTAAGRRKMSQIGG